MADVFLAEAHTNQQDKELVLFHIENVTKRNINRWEEIFILYFMVCFVK